MTPSSNPLAPKSKDGLSARVMAGVVMAPPVLAAIYFGYPYFDVLVALMVAVLAWEWSRLTSGEGRFGVEGVVLAAGNVAAVALAAMGRTETAFAAMGATALAAALTAQVTGRGDAERGLWMFLGGIYVGAPCVAAVWLRAEPQAGLMVMVWIVAVVWATDIGAYVFGKTIGGPKLLPRISPKKTWAGLLGGVLCAALAGGAVVYLFGGAVTPLLVVLGGLMAVVAQGGDFFESWVKRRFGVKDASNLIPGHGGLLDRVDGLLAVLLAVHAGLHVAAAFGMGGRP